VNDVGPPDTVSVTEPLEVQVSANAAGVTLTASLKVTVRFVAAGTPVAPSAGDVEMTAGAASGGNSPLAVMETSSIARPSSLEVMLKSVQRIQIVPPLGTDSPEIVELTALRLPVALHPARLRRPQGWGC